MEKRQIILAVALAGALSFAWGASSARAGIGCEVDADCTNFPHDACSTPFCHQNMGSVGGAFCDTEPITCDDFDECTLNTCDPQKGCQFPPLPAIDDGDPCTTDTCDDGDITHTPVQCISKDQCEIGQCVQGECIFENVCEGLTPRQCYDVSPRTPFQPLVLGLADRFGDFVATLQTARELCAPAVLGLPDGRGDFFDGTHELAYRLIGKTIRPFTPVKGLVVQNAFGTSFIDVKYPERLWIPTAKSLVSPPEITPEPFPLFTCYYVRRSKGAPKNPMPKNLATTTQFEDGTILKLKKLNRICVQSRAFEDSRGPAPMLDQAYLCYQNNVPPLGPVDKVFTNNVLEPAAIYRVTGVHEEVCLPSTILPPIE